MKLEFKQLSEIDCPEYVALNTNPLVMRQMRGRREEFGSRDGHDQVRIASD